VQPTRFACALAASLALLAATACSGGDSDEDTPDDLAARLEAARATLDDAESLQIRLVTDSLPDNIEGLVEADGVGNHEPAFEGTVVVATNSVGQIDAEVVSVPGDIVVSSWLTATEGLQEDGQTRDGEDVLTAVIGQLPGTVVQSLIPSADESADFAVEYRITDDDALRSAAITGPFYPDGADVTYDLEVEPSSEPVDIVLP
jgi:lipoprotein LprG